MSNLLKFTMNFSTNNIKGIGNKTIKKSGFVFSCVFLACMALSTVCKSQTIKSLYLSREGLDSLVNKVKKNIIVLQFFVNKSGNLTLYAWPKRNDEGHNEKIEGVMLDTVKNSPPLSTTGNNYLLANLQIGKDQIKSLRRAKYKYYIFLPSKDYIDEVNIFHIYYDIRGTNEDPKLGNVPQMKALAFIATTKNPSPPR
jgi:hypothetical protein